MRSPEELPRRKNACAFPSREKHSVTAQLAISLAEQGITTNAAILANYSFAGQPGTQATTAVSTRTIAPVANDATSSGATP